MEPSERAIDMLATENTALRQEIKELKAENAELRDCSGRAKELMKELDDEIGTLKKRVTELKAEKDQWIRDYCESQKENAELKAETENLRIARSVADPVKLLEENATLKARVEELEARDKTLKKFAEKFKQEPIPPEFNKIIDDHFWELFA